MLYRTTIGLWWWFLPSIALSQSSQNHVVLQDEERRFAAMVRRDTTELSKWLSDDLVYRHSNGLLEDKRSHMRAIAAGVLHYERIERDSAYVQRFGRLALVNGVVRVSGQLEQRPFAVRLAYLAAYRKSRGRWQLLRWQSTRLAE